MTSREITPDARFLFVDGYVAQPPDPADLNRIVTILSSDTTWRLHRYGAPLKSTRPCRQLGTKPLRQVWTGDVGRTVAEPD